MALAGSPSCCSPRVGSRESRISLFGRSITSGAPWSFTWRCPSCLDPGLLRGAGADRHARLPGPGTRLARLGPIAPAMGWLALPFLVVPGFANLGEASLNNYVPVILHPLYGVGLALVFGGVFLAVVRLLANFSNTGERPDPAVFGLAVVGVVYLAALACFGIASPPSVPVPMAKAIWRNSSGAAVTCCNSSIWA